MDDNELKVRLKRLHLAVSADTALSEIRAIELLSNNLLNAARAAD